jgi:hypothetical protein
VAAASQQFQEGFFRMKHGGNRNFGFGKQMSYAGHRALAGSFQGHYGTVAAHSQRWAHFCNWARECDGIKDARDVTVDTLTRYASHLSQRIESGAMTVAYAQNLISSANVTLQALREDHAIKVSPSEMVGTRTCVRTDPPLSLNPHKVDTAIQILRGSGHHHAATVLEVARTLGLREREAAMADYHRFSREAGKNGEINVTEGTKGNRGEYVDRWVPVSDAARAAIERAASLQGDNRNIIPAHMSWKQFENLLHNHATRTIFQEQGLTAFHDARAAYACERYLQITGQPAPCVAGERLATKDVDRAARAIISQELGHSRIDVVASYIGSAK